MRLRIFSSVRWLLALVVVVAPGVALSLDIRNHSRRDLQCSRVMTDYMVANWHCREAMKCRTQSSPYSRAIRIQVNRDYFPGALPGTVASWGAEASFHGEWADRFSEKAETGLRELDEIYAKLLFR